MTDPDDIVARLRAVLNHDRAVELISREAADKIEQLREERDHARRRVCRDEIQRGGVCRREGSNTIRRFQTPEEVAKWLGWNCFDFEWEER